MSKFYSFKDLPDDMQVLLFELVERVAGEQGLQKLEQHSFKVQTLPVEIFPSVLLSTDYRDEQYASAMIGRSFPPVVIHGDKWIDGRHRIWALKQSGAPSVECLDLIEVFSDYPFEPTGVLDSSFTYSEKNSNA